MGLFLAGILHVYLPTGFVRRALNRAHIGSVLRAVLIGVPMPLCSCGVIPAALGLRRDGASRGATTAFMISTPQTGVDSILVSASFLGWPFALFKVIAAFFTGLLGGALVNRFTDSSEGSELETAVVDEKLAEGSRIKEIFRYAIFDLLGAIDLWIIAGVVIAAMITLFTPEDFFASMPWAQGVVGLLLVLFISTPLYVCTTGSVPIAASLIAAGMPLGSALVFLMAGPATNVATIGAVYRTLGGRVLGLYLGTVIVMSFILGLTFDFVLISDTVQTSHEHSSLSDLNKISAVVVIMLLAWLSMKRIGNHFFKTHEIVEDDMSTNLKVEGMTCPHCVANVKKSLEAVKGVETADPDLASGNVRVEGDDLDNEALARAVEAAGYKVVR